MLSIKIKQLIRCIYKAHSFSPTYIIFDIMCEDLNSILIQYELENRITICFNKFQFVSISRFWQNI
jgi:hypothetical protein